MTPLTNKALKKGLELKWEITIVLIVKFILLWLLWNLFFSRPEARHMYVPPPQVAQHVLSENFPLNTGLSTSPNPAHKTESISK